MKQIFTRIQALILLTLAILSAAVFALPAKSALAAATCQTYYTVKAGDTLAAISIKYNVLVDDMVKANKLFDPYMTIYVRQSLCIPVKPRPFTSATSTANRVAADYTTKLKGGLIYLYLRNFPNYSSFNVKVGPPPGEKLSQLNTRNNTNINVSYKLPDKLLKAKQVIVCLKNMMTDFNICRTALP
jgi:LysM repeat protein